MRKAVLVFRTGHLGDTVCAIPAFRLIRSHFANEELVLLCDHLSDGDKVPAVEVVQSLGIFDRIITYTSGQGVFSVWQLFRAVRAVQPSLLIILPQSQESVRRVRRKKRFFLGCGVADVRGLEMPGSRNGQRPAEPDRLVGILRGMGISGTKPAYDIPIDSARRASVYEKLRSNSFDVGRPLIIFCGGGKVATQCWPLERYAAVLSRLSAEMNCEVIGVGNSQEIDSYRARVLPIFGALRLLSAPLTVPELFELCRLASVYFGNDTGPMHVSAAVGCPVAVVMSGRNAPGMWDPDVELRLIIRHRTECENCFLTDCIVMQHRCMAEITVERVTAEVIPFVKSLLSRGAGTP